MMRALCDINTQGVKEYFCSRSIEYQTLARSFIIEQISHSHRREKNEEVEKEEKFKNNREKRDLGVFGGCSDFCFSLFFSLFSLSREKSSLRLLFTSHHSFSDSLLN